MGFLKDFPGGLVWAFLATVRHRFPGWRVLHVLLFVFLICFSRRRASSPRISPMFSRVAGGGIQSVIKKDLQMNKRCWFIRMHGHLISLSQNFEIFSF